MKRLVFFFLAIGLSNLAAWSQVTVISGQVISQWGQPVPFAKVRVCSVTSTGTPCTPTALIYTDYNMVHLSPNPATADQNGNYAVYGPQILAPNLYLVQVSPQAGTT